MFKLVAASVLVISVFVTGGALLGGCSAATAQAQKEARKGRKKVLEQVVKVGAAELKSGSGLPMTVDYFNLDQPFSAAAYRLALDLPEANGWRQTKNDEMVVFTFAKENEVYKWQRIAVFKGKLDKDLKPVPKTEGGWVNIIVYRVPQPSS